MKQPPLGWTTTVKLKRVIDGDTICVTVEKEITIRITDDAATFNTPEIRRRKGITEEEIQRGHRALLDLSLLLENSEIIMHIATDEDGKIADMFSIGSRAVAQVFVNGINVADKMSELGHNKSADNYLGKK